MQFYPNGIGGALGDPLVTARPLLMSGNVWYVHHTGTNAASPAGRDREKPLAGLTQALTNAVAGDVIVCLSGHAETSSGQYAFNKAGITLVGEGDSQGNPTVKFTANGSPVAPALFEITAAGVKIRNIWFPSNLLANTVARTHVSAAGGEFSGCYFECAGNDQAAGLRVSAGANNMRVVGCTFISTASSVASQPSPGLLNDGAVSDLDIIDCIFDAGTAGFVAANALDLSAAAVTRLRIEGCSFLRGADFVINAATTGYANPQLSTGGSRGSW